MTDKAVLSPRARQPRSDEDVVAGVGRLIEAVGKRAATADPGSAAHLTYLRDALDDAFTAAVAGWRSLRFSDSQIGRELGVTKQAVQQRWPR
jgi:hypothetical protein